MRDELGYLFFPEPPLTLYHYCSASTFIKIIESRKLWLTDFSKMNDYAEETWAAKLVYQLHSQMARNEEGSECFCNHYQEEYESRRLRARKFLCCFSENGDSLSQWRAYSDNGAGFAIGFNTHRLRLIRNIPIPTIPDDQRRFLIKICYDHEKQTEFIKSCLRINANENSREEFRTAYHLAFLSIAMKNPGFIEEEEWRIVYAPLDLRLNINDTRAPILFRNSNRGIAPYFEHEFSYEAVLEIIVGPTNQTTDEDLNLFLARCGFDNIHITRANATYRG